MPLPARLIPPTRFDLLEQIAAMLENFPADRQFRIDDWVRREYDPEAMEFKNEVTCGTRCCAVGWAALLLPAVQEAGLSIDLYHECLSARVKGRGYSSWDAVEIVLGLDYDDAQELFGLEDRPAADVTPADVAAKVRKFIETRKPQVPA